MINKVKILKITLKSDLCAGSGYSYAGIIDSDVCYDSYGFPYIPARRIKGCLREAAEMICMDPKIIGRLFGSRGQNEVQGIYVENAYLPQYEAMKEELQRVTREHTGYQKYLNPQNILDQFTGLKSQTRIDDNGVAVNNSLRITRTINHYSPLDNTKETEFFAKITFAESNQPEGGQSDDFLEQNLRNAVKALRNMGLNRTRGLGSVCCELLPYEKDSDDSGKDKAQGTGRGQAHVKITGISSEQMEDDTPYVLEYTIQNREPLMLSASNDAVSEKYISGQSVIGFLAGAYLRRGSLADTETFRNLFLKNQVYYSCLYPCDDNRIYYPVPSYINKLKKTEKLVNVSKDQGALPPGLSNQEKEAYNPENGNQPKKLKGKFAAVRSEEDSDCRNCKTYKYKIKEVETDLVFHHTKKADAEDTNQEGSTGETDRSQSGKQEMLYSLEVIRAGQSFRGTIQGKGRNLKIIRKLLEDEPLRFGKSKSAQYGYCILTKGSVSKANLQAFAYHAGDRILVVLQSDAIFTFADDKDHSAGYTVRYKEVREKIREQLGIPARPVCYETDNYDENRSLQESESGERKEYSEIEVKMLTGYYSKWNLKRQAIPAVAAGSTFEYVLEQDWNSEAWAGDDRRDLKNRGYVGERNGEGYGQAVIVCNNNPSYALEMDKAEAVAEESKPAAGQTPADLQMEDANLKYLCRKILLQEAMEILNQNALEAADRQKENKQITSAAWGRVALMLAESVEMHPNAPEAAYNAFWKLIGSIKREDLRKQITAFLEQSIGPKEAYQHISFSDCQKNTGTGSKKKNASLKRQEQLAEIGVLYDTISSQGSFWEALRKNWADYLGRILTGIKYRRKNGKQKGAAEDRQATD